MSEKIFFRPHHFLCAIGFQGKGYSASFILNFQNIMDKLNSPIGNECKITVVAHTDSICEPCPHKKNLFCHTEMKIRVLDLAHAAILQVQPGNVIKWGDAKNRIKKNMSLEKFHQACETCEWKKLGVCETSLRALLTSDN